MVVPYTHLHAPRSRTDQHHRRRPRRQPEAHYRGLQGLGGEGRGARGLPGTRSLRLPPPGPAVQEALCPGRRGVPGADRGSRGRGARPGRDGRDEQDGNGPAVLQRRRVLPPRQGGQRPPTSACLLHLRRTSTAEDRYFRAGGEADPVIVRMRGSGSGSRSARTSGRTR